jgi:hypothetical protein
MQAGMSVCLSDAGLVQAAAYARRHVCLSVRCWNLQPSESHGPSMKNEAWIFQLKKKFNIEDDWFLIRSLVARAQQ